MRWSPPEQKAQPPSLGEGPVSGQENASDVGGLAGVVERPVQLVHGVGAEGVADLGAVEGDPDGAGRSGPVIGDVGEVETRHLIPEVGVEEGGDHGGRLEARSLPVADPPVSVGVRFQIHDHVADDMTSR
jgi:hypothetical protein